MIVILVAGGELVSQVICKLLHGLVQEVVFADMLAFVAYIGVDEEKNNRAINAITIRFMSWRYYYIISDEKEGVFMVINCSFVYQKLLLE